VYEKMQLDWRDSTKMTVLEILIKISHTPVLNSHRMRLSIKIVISLIFPWIFVTQSRIPESAVNWRWRRRKMALDEAQRGGNESSTALGKAREVKMKPQTVQTVSHR
jgi:hypothetical protein